MIDVYGRILCARVRRLFNLLQQHEVGSRRPTCVLTLRYRRRFMERLRDLDCRAAACCVAPLANMTTKDDESMAAMCGGL